MTTTYPDTISAAREDILERAINAAALPAPCTAAGCEMIYDEALPGHFELCDWHRHTLRMCTYNGCMTRQEKLDHGLCSEHAKGLRVMKASRNARASSVKQMEIYHGAKERQVLKTMNLTPRLISEAEYRRGITLIEGMDPLQRSLAGREHEPRFPANKNFKSADGSHRRMCTIVWAILSGNYVIEN